MEEIDKPQKTEAVLSIEVRLKNRVAEVDNIFAELLKYWMQALLLQKRGSSGLQKLEMHHSS